KSVNFFKREDVIFELQQAFKNIFLPSWQVCPYALSASVKPFVDILVIKNLFEDSLISNIYLFLFFKWNRTKYVLGFPDYVEGDIWIFGVVEDMYIVVFNFPDGFIPEKNAILQVVFQP